VGDYLLQPKWMAMNKSGNTITCLLHCITYTFAIGTFTFPVLPHHNLIWWAPVVFLSHFPIDRFNLADKWLNLINGRSLSDFLSHGQDHIPDEFDRSNYHALRGGFTAFVYGVTDNTMHLAVMYLVAVWLFN